MRAGSARRPAITSARSAPSAGRERSTTRYCIGFESGTGGLGHEPLDEALHPGVAPVAHAEDRIADAAARVDDEGHRQPPHVPAARGVLLRVEHDRQLDE